MKLHFQADLELEYSSHAYRLTSGPAGLELTIPSVAAAIALLGVADAHAWMQQAERVLQAVEQQVKVTYRGLTLVTLGTGDWTAAGVAQALKWLK
ncbi:hypothetical protein DYH09_20890 [bacterium CPR1]|nr:hypothetical protein [bacterium CPR1]